MKFAVVKLVDDRIIGAVIGPFKYAEDAEAYAVVASKFSLGYEKWEVRELQKPAKLT
jgi:hypothetical protein